LPDVEGDRPTKKKLKSYPIGYFHVDIAEVRTEQGKLHMFMAIDRTSKFDFVELHEKATTAVSREVLLRLIAAVPYKIHTVLTDNGIQFTTPGAGGSAVPLIKEAIANGERFWAHAFEYTCATNDIEHRTTRARHPWTNGQVERMNRTIKDATVKRFYYESHDRSAGISPISSPPTTSPAGSRPSKGSHPTSSSAGRGLHSPNASISTRSSKCRN
jgi:transposase InsO family protein